MSETPLDSSWMDAGEEDAETPKPLTDKQKQRLERRALNVAMYQLELGSRTRKQIEDRLIKKEIPQDIIDETIERLMEIDLINDEEFAHDFVRIRHESRKQGTGVIRRELSRKGVDRELAEEAVATIDPEDEWENARHLVSKRIHQSRGLDRYKRTQRLVGMLARKGYSGSIAYSVVKEALDNEPVEEEEE